MRRLVGFLAASGVLAAIVAFGLPKAFDWAASQFSETSALKVHIDDDGGFVPVQGSLWAFADSAPRVGAGTPTELRDAGSIQVKLGIVAVTVENTGTRALTISSIRAVVGLPRKDPIGGAILHVAPGGGGAEPPPVNVGFALDTDDLEARVMADGEPGLVHYLDQHGVALKPGEQLRLRMAGHSRQHYVTWSAVLRYVSDGKPTDIPIGTPKQFHVTAISATYTGAYEYSAARGFQPIPLTDLCAADCRTSLKG